MPKFHHDVIYTGDKGEEPAWVVGTNDDKTLELASWDGNGYVARHSVPEKLAGDDPSKYGHTWRENG